MFISPLELLVEEAARGAAENDCEKRAEFENSVSPGKAMLGQEFGQQPVLRRTEKGAVDPHQRNSGERHREMFVTKPEPGEGHDPELEDFDAEAHGAFAQAVRQPAARHGEKDERK